MLHFVFDRQNDAGDLHQLARLKCKKQPLYACMHGMHVGSLTSMRPETSSCER